MVSSIYGNTDYTQVSRKYQERINGQNSTAAGRTTAPGEKNKGVNKSAAGTAESVAERLQGKIREWKPLSEGSPLIPTQKTGYGTVIGDVELSDKAKEYYSKLKSKFHGMDFILVSNDLKSQVAKNAAAYGNANKPVVLIDEEKLERMATDESFRKKYEGIIAMSQTKLQEAKNSLTSSGAAVKNFGISVDSNGNMSFFATIEKSAEQQAKAAEKRLEKKRAEKAKEKKLEEKRENKERIEKLREKNRADRAEVMDAKGRGPAGTDKENERAADPADASDAAGKGEAAEAADSREYMEIRAGSLEDLISRVSAFAFDAADRAFSPQEEQVGQHIDFRG